MSCLFRLPSWIGYTCVGRASKEERKRLLRQLSRPSPLRGMWNLPCLYCLVYWEIQCSTWHCHLPSISHQVLFLYCSRNPTPAFLLPPSFGLLRLRRVARARRFDSYSVSKGKTLLETPLRSPSWFRTQRLISLSSRWSDLPFWVVGDFAFPWFGFMVLGIVTSVCSPSCFGRFGLFFGSVFFDRSFLLLVLRFDPASLDVGDLARLVRFSLIDLLFLFCRRLDRPFGFSEILLVLGSVLFDPLFSLSFC